MARSFHNVRRKGALNDLYRGKRAERTATRITLKTATDWDNTVVPVVPHCKDYDRAGVRAV
jgi:hypothetical protein